MFFIASLLIDTAILGALLLIFAKINFVEEYVKPMSVILLTSAASFATALVLQGALWGIPQLVIVVAVLFYLLGWFFDIPRKEHRIIVGAFFGIKFLLAVIGQLL